jgi:hypothetical protein
MLSFFKITIMFSYILFHTLYFSNNFKLTRSIQQTQNKKKIVQHTQNNHRNKKKCFEGTHVDVNTIVQKAQRSIFNFKNASGVLLEMLSGGPNMLISDVHWTTPPSGYYKLNVDAAGPIEGGRWGIGIVVGDDHGVVVAATCWQVLSLSY